MAVNNMLSNVPGAVPYVSMVNDQANAVLIGLVPYFSVIFPAFNGNNPKLIPTAK